MAVEEDRTDDAPPPATLSERARGRAASATRWAEELRERHVLGALPFLAAERNRRVAASVMAGGLAYRLFFWLLPFALILGGVLGFLDARDAEDAIEAGGVPGAVVDAVGDVSREAESSRWWLIAVGVPLLAWAGYTGARAVRLVHAIVWDEPLTRANPAKTSLAFSAFAVGFMASIALVAWVREHTQVGGLLLLAFAVVPLVALWLLVSLQVPHRHARWRDLLPGAILFAVGLQLLHLVTFVFLLPKVENASALYGGLGAAGTVLLWGYLVGRLIVTSPILNASLLEERERRAPTSG